MFKRLIKSKTAWVAAGGILTAIGAALSGQIDWSQAVEAIFAGLVALFLRDGIAKIK